MAESPTARTMRWWRERDALVDKAEHWDHFAKKTKDLFGIVDLVVIDAAYGMVLLQVTDGSNHSKRRKKLQQSDLWDYLSLYAPEVMVGVQSWRKNAKGRWTTRLELWDGTTPEDEPTGVDL